MSCRPLDLRQFLGSMAREVAAFSAFFDGVPISLHPLMCLRSSRAQGTVHAVSGSTLFQLPRPTHTKAARTCMNYAGEWGGSFQIPTA